MNSNDFFAQENDSTYKIILERISEESKQIMIQTLVGCHSMCYEVGSFQCKYLGRTTYDFKTQQAIFEKLIFLSF